jgi:hypothetical protein
MYAGEDQIAGKQLNVKIADNWFAVDESNGYKNTKTPHVYVENFARGHSKDINPIPGTKPKLWGEPDQPGKGDPNKPPAPTLKHRNCLGCYEDPPDWIKPKNQRHHSTNKNREE